MNQQSLASKLAAASPAQRKKFFAQLTEAKARALQQSWEFHARPKQLPPSHDDWFIWLLRTGRGFGKTRAGAEWVHQRAMAGDSRRWIALIGSTPADVRDVMMDGPGGLMKNVKDGEVPTYNPSSRRVTWPTGAYATIFSGAHPEQLRGYSGDTAWCDELAAWKYPADAWNNLMFGLREAKVSDPKVCVTTTPKPIALIRTLAKRAEAGRGVVMVTGSSWENRENLSPQYYAEVIEPVEGTVLGRQEVEGQLIDEHPDALWTLAQLDEDRVEVRPPEFTEIAIAVDPATTSTDESAETGITAGGMTAAGHGYLLVDASLRAKPGVWAQRVIDMYYELDADFVVVETNQGGDMVAHTIHSLDTDIPIKQVHASRGKQTRAQPISSKSSQHLIHHVGAFESLEDQLTGWVPGDDSPDRLDSYVWLWTYLFRIGREMPTGVMPVSMEEESRWVIE